MTWMIKCEAKRSANRYLENIMHAAMMANISVGGWSDHVLHHIHVQLSAFAHVRWEDWAQDCLGISQQDLPDSEIQKLRDRSTTAAGSHCSRRNKEALRHCNETIIQKQVLSLFLYPHTISFSVTHTHVHFPPHHLCTPPTHSPSPSPASPPPQIA